MADLNDILNSALSAAVPVATGKLLIKPGKQDPIDLAGAIGSDASQLAMYGIAGPANVVRLAGGGAALGALNEIISPYTQELAEAGSSAGKHYAKKINPDFYNAYPENSTSVTSNMIRQTPEAIGETLGQILPMLAETLLLGKVIKDEKPNQKIEKPNQKIKEPPVGEKYGNMTRSEMKDYDKYLANEAQTRDNALTAKAEAKKVDEALNKKLYEGDGNILIDLSQNHPEILREVLGQRRAEIEKGFNYTTYGLPVDELLKKRFGQDYGIKRVTPDNTIQFPKKSTGGGMDTGGGPGAASINDPNLTPKEPIKPEAKLDPKMEAYNKALEWEYSRQNPVNIIANALDGATPEMQMKILIDNIKLYSKSGQELFNDLYNHWKAMPDVLTGKPGYAPSLDMFRKWMEADRLINEEGLNKSKKIRLFDSSMDQVRKTVSSRLQSELDPELQRILAQEAHNMPFIPQENVLGDFLRMKPSGYAGNYSIEQINEMGKRLIELGRNGDPETLMFIHDTLENLNKEFGYEPNYKQESLNLDIPAVTKPKDSESTWLKTPKNKQYSKKEINQFLKEKLDKPDFPGAGPGAASINDPDMQGSNLTSEQELRNTVAKAKRLEKGIYEARNSEIADLLPKADKMKTGVDRHYQDLLNQGITPEELNVSGLAPEPLINHLQNLVESETLTNPILGSAFEIANKAAGRIKNGGVPTREDIKSFNNAQDKLRKMLKDAKGERATLINRYIQNIQNYIDKFEPRVE